MPRSLPNVILITADSLRADHLGSYGYSRPTSPNLDRFAQQCRRFTQAFSNGPNTPHAFPPIMATRYPLASSRLGLFDAPVTLPEVLKSAGYTTLGFNAANPYLSRLFNYHRGFDEFDDYFDMSTPAQKRAPSLNQSEIVTIPQMALEQYVISEESIHRKAGLESELHSQIFACLRKHSSQRVFLWVHYMDTHYPYLPQPAAQRVLGFPLISKEENLKLNARIRENLECSPELLKKIIELYDAAIRQLDAKLGEMFGFLQQHGLYDSALIIFAADHGEEFQEHGDVQHKSKLYDELLRVPLLMKLPFSRHGETRDELVSLIQVAPTIISLIGMQNPFTHEAILNQRESGIVAEASYFKNGGPPVDQQILNIDPLPKRFCYRDRNWKLIIDTAEPQPVLFNLVNDPFERQNVYRAESEPGRHLLEVLEEHINAEERQRLTSKIARVRENIPPLKGGRGDVKGTSP